MGWPRELTEEQKSELRAQGYRPVEVWLPDMLNPAVLALADAEAKRRAAADQEEGIIDWIDAVQKDMWESQ